MKVNHIDDRDLQKLWVICDDLYGNGSSLNPDKRRDMANMMRTILENIETTEADAKAAVVLHGKLEK